MIHKVKETYVISSGGTWLPGVYASKEAAYYAFQFCNTDLKQIRDKNPNVAMTSDMLKEFRYNAL